MSKSKPGFWGRLSDLLKAPSFFPAENGRPTIADYKVIVDRFLAHALYWGLLLSALYGLAGGARLGTIYPIAPIPLALASAFVGMLLALALSSASIALGALAGFVFGLPRSLTSAEVREGSRLATSAAAASDGSDQSGGVGNASSSAGRVPGYGTNSNLERISDWLTTILVGVGLMQLQTIIPAIERFGDHAGVFFVSGGKLFSISAGLYFLTAGFLLSYMNTRTKIVLIFTENDITQIDLRTAPPRAAYKSMYEIDPVTPGEGDKDRATGAEAPSLTVGGGVAQPNPVSDLVKGEAEVLAQKSAIEARTPQELLAIANARALTGDYAGALSFYRDVYKWPNYTLSEDDLGKFAGVIGLNGDAELFNQLQESLRLNGQDAATRLINPSFDAGVKSALQANLYNSRFDESIRLGRIYFGRNTGKPDGWAHLWMACALGQKHAASRTLDEKDPSLDALCVEAADEAAQAIKDEPSLDRRVSELAFPAAGATDNDLLTVADCLVAKKVISRTATDKTEESQDAGG